MMESEIEESGEVGLIGKSEERSCKNCKKRVDDLGFSCRIVSCEPNGAIERSFWVSLGVG